MAGEKIDSFTKLKAWNSSHILAIAIIKALAPLLNNDVVKNQLERAALSVGSNIAEGFGRQSIADKKHFYIIARGSAYEVQNHLLVARDTKKITEQKFQELALLSLDSIRLLHGLIRSLNNKLNANS